MGAGFFHCPDSTFSTSQHTPRANAGRTLAWEICSEVQAPIEQLASASTANAVSSTEVGPCGNPLHPPSALCAANSHSTPLARTTETVFESACPCIVLPSSPVFEDGDEKDPASSFNANTTRAVP